MSYNGSGTFSVNTAGQPVVSGTTISDTVFNALTADIATGLSTAICKDGQTTVTANIPFGGFKATNLAVGTANTDGFTVQNVNARSMCEGRLTLTSGTAVTTADVTAATTVYFTPYKGNCIALYDGTNWVRRTFSEISIAVPATTATMYDVWAYDNSGTVTLEATAWTNTTTRATALALQDGVLCKTGALTRRYLGSFCTTGVSGQTEDSLANRFLWNYYNRAVRPMRRIESTASWNYTTATYRQANSSTSNQLNFIVGVSEDVVTAYLQSAFSNTNTGVGVRNALALDSVTVPATTGLLSYATSALANGVMPLSAQLKGYPGIGKHYIAWLEISGATGTTTFYGNLAAIGAEGSGIQGDLLG